ncbi:hypothetical protein [Paenibacillus spongiae]|uniref:Uncharacterized protein n=1 Tax=Paenibacillus spongiae TaxID=2909671 RepID=A0ABY5S6Q9_9BACL|nr:hypothetical protein [Paenibacillus spongiae]UVI29589.1 hypothetical protein L1F29_29935 [Paenibacillus spongiae]
MALNVRLLNGQSALYEVQVSSDIQAYYHGHFTLSMDKPTAAIGFNRFIQQADTL